ncbi:chromate transporter [Alkalicoccobacillus murimartini]|uniref:Chromate transporter n=1 Tax=Alkalicoccobacillus murimartini TaxID=171685 RepID=A0ABT9YKD4_9BACI|nr:chromate transporter [Alkalicoccobacillus murimartini]MDQ0208313.1 chromate transporter [Alkalicoccobacillus murimartini]
MNWKMQKDLFIAFFRSTMLGYGGGPSTIPLVHDEVVKRYKWMDDEEFGDILAIGNTLPGPIATKMAGYIGYRLGGWAGMLNALFATVIPTVVILAVLLGILSSFSESSIVQGMTQAVTPVVGVMLLVMTYTFVKQSGKGLGWIGTVILGVVSFVGMQLLGIHPAIIIVVLIAFALLKPVKKQNEQQAS